MNDTIALLKNHRSIREFTPEPVSDDVVREIIEAAGWSATSNFIQAYTVIRVRNKQTRQQIAELAGSQSWVETSPVFLVFCADLKRSQAACDYESQEMVSGYTEQFIIATVDVSLAAQNAMIAAESFGLGGVFIGGIRNNPEQVSELLKLPEQVYPVFGMCLGYPSASPEQKPRLPVDVILKEESYQQDKSELEQYNETCKAYYQNRSSGARDETWTHQIATMMSKPMRPHMKAFLENKGFKFK
ncbi:MAG TPA: oxygen-insensitive NADPH nitroreductase [Methylophaga aminisulfidivorans]|uniref:oxygen-insensitive NADPH nitroreductase n=1 Tax=Methylophaga TaxID=40222 RepID=UPI0017752E48|nr:MULTISPECIES: oxygen-insensitive NADPH nitroreductase [Methylophaga]HIC47007.1 oxygen-insensitive NADPH nitroreductase [Methylophaga sp.]HIM40191.1 oxygen-insensitive NADPH nitroreductase [Methylophaga aminisulfidivorans]